MSTVLPPAESFPPGEFLRDELEERGWSEAEFAQIIGRPAQAVSEIVNGRKEITAETAVAFGEALGTSAELWLNLQAAYRLHAVRSQLPKELTAVSRRARLRSLVPVAELRKRGWIADTDDLDALESAVCELLQIESPDDAPQLVAAARRANPLSEFSPQQVAWLARVQRIAEQRAWRPFDVARLRSLAPDLVGRIHNPHDLTELDSWLEECGVALVIELPLRGSKIDGVAMVLPGTPIIGLSTRGDRFDSFLFTLLHEIAHLTLGHLKMGELQIDEDLLSDEPGTDAEGEANEQAASWIFPGGLEPPDGALTMPKIVSLARAAHVHPSFVIGRLQRDGLLGWEKFRNSIPKVRPFIKIG